MSELSSSKKILATNSSNPNNRNANIHKKVSNTDPVNKQGDNFIANADKQDKNVANLQYEDKFSSMRMDKAVQNKDLLKNPFLKNSEEAPRNAQRALPSSGIIKNPVVKTYINVQQRINTFMSRYVDIMDKIAAVFGEKEKDIREKLSDTSKRIKTKIHSLLEKVDTSMEQKDHQKEKKIKDPEKETLKEDPNIHRVDNSTT